MTAKKAQNLRIAKQAAPDGSALLGLGDHVFKALPAFTDEDEKDAVFFADRYFALTKLDRDRAGESVNKLFRDEQRRFNEIGASSPLDLYICLMAILNKRDSVGGLAWLIIACAMEKKLEWRPDIVKYGLWLGRSMTIGFDKGVREHIMPDAVKHRKVKTAGARGRQGNTKKAAPEKALICCMASDLMTNGTDHHKVVPLIVNELALKDPKFNKLASHEKGKRIAAIGQRVRRALENHSWGFEKNKQKKLHSPRV